LLENDLSYSKLATLFHFKTTAVGLTRQSWKFYRCLFSLPRDATLRARLCHSMSSIILFVRPSVRPSV